MKILVISQRVCWPLKDGGAICMYNTLQGLKEQGADLTYLALNPLKFNIDMTEAARELSRFGEFRWVDIDTGIKVKDAFLNLFTSESYNICRFKSERFSKLIKDTIKTEGPFDIIQFESSFVSIYLKDAREVCDSVMVSHQHNAEFQIWERLASGTTGILKRKYLGLLAKRLLKFEQQALPKFDAVLAITNQDLQAFRDLGVTQPIMLFPAGIDVDAYERPAIRPEAETVGHIAFMEWMPNQEALEWFLDEVWPLVVDKVPHARLNAAGKGMPERFHMMGIENMMLHGEVDDAAGFMKHQQVLIVPLLSGSGIRLKIIEAMATGVPVVTTSIGLQGIDAVNNVHLLTADSPEAFAEQVVKILQDPEFAARLASAGKQFVEENFSLHALARKQMDFYRDLLTRRIPLTT